MMKYGVSWSVDCPKCSTSIDSASCRCGNCGSGPVLADVIVQHTVASIFLKCDICKSSVPFVSCSGCGIEMRSLIHESVESRVKAVPSGCAAALVMVVSSTTVLFAASNLLGFS